MRETVTADMSFEDHLLRRPTKTARRGLTVAGIRAELEASHREFLAAARAGL